METILISCLLSILGFIGIMMVKQLSKIAKSVQKIEVEMARIITTQEAHEKTIEKHETRIHELEKQ